MRKGAESMTFASPIRKHGKSSVITIPKEVCDVINPKEGEMFIISVAPVKMIEKD